MKIAKILYFVLLAQAIMPWLVYGQNPFLRPGSERPKTPTIVRPAPPPPPPKPLNTNLELRGFFKFGGEWYFSIFDKSKNKGVWLQQGERFDDGKIEIESFNEETEVVKIKGGTTLSLKKSDNKVLPVPSGQPIKKTTSSTKKPIIPSRVPIQKGTSRSITIPPRSPSIPQRSK